jgi:hypothetical protein
VKPRRLLAGNVNWEEGGNFLCIFSFSSISSLFEVLKLIYGEPLDTLTLTQSRVHSFISLFHSLAHPFIHSFTESSIRSLTHSLTHPFNHAFIHSLTNPYTHCVQNHSLRHLTHFSPTDSPMLIHSSFHPLILLTQFAPYFT